MTMLTLSLPDELAQRARNAGLLSDAAIGQLLETAVRHSAGSRLLEAAERLHAANLAPMSDEDILSEIKAVRAERKARYAGGA